MLSSKALPFTAKAKIGAAKTPPVTPPAAPTSAKAGIDNFLLLMRHELAEPLGKVAELAELSRRGADTADRLIALSELLAGPPILADEHIVLTDRLHRAAADLVEAAQTRGVGLRLDDSRQNMAVVYGSR